MSIKLFLARFAAYSPILLSGLIAIGGLTGCPAPCEQNPTLPECPRADLQPPPIDMGSPVRQCLPACGLHERCNTGSLQCDCESGYLRQAGQCKPICEVSPSDPSCPPPPLPDLVPESYSLTRQKTPTTVSLCFGPSGYVAVENTGPVAAGAHSASVGLFDVTDGKIVGGCAAPMRAGTAAGATTRFSATNQCCTLTPSDVTHTFKVYVCADVLKEVAESDESNNCFTGSPFVPFAPETPESESVSMKRPSFNDGMSSLVLQDTTQFGMSKWLTPLH